LGHCEDGEIRYLVAMHLRTKRRITAVITAALFVVSLGLHGLLTTPANAQMAPAPSHMFSGDDPMNCPGQDGADPAICYAICTAFIGIVFEPARLPVVLSHKIHAGALIVSLRDRSIPPDPYPPRPSALI
jgi:hypothetical protein